MKFSVLHPLKHDDDSRQQHHTQKTAQKTRKSSGRSQASSKQISKKARRQASAKSVGRERGKTLGVSTGGNANAADPSIVVDAASTVDDVNTTDATNAANTTNTTGAANTADTAPQLQDSDQISSTVRQVTCDNPDVAREAQLLAERFRLRQPRITQHPDLPPVIRKIVIDAQDRMNMEMQWYHDLLPDDKNQLNIVAETAVANFVSWFDEINQLFIGKDGIGSADSAAASDHATNGRKAFRRDRRDQHDAPAQLTFPPTAGPDSKPAKLPRPHTDEIFFVAPLEFTKSISLNQVVELTRFIVDAMEANVTRFAAPGQKQAALNAMMYYSREVAFSAANVYASSAQARGDWDARLEALTIADLLEGTPPSHQVASRLNLLGWRSEFSCFAVTGTLAHTGDISLSLAHRHVREAVRTLGGECLISEHDDLTVLLIDPKQGMAPEDFVQSLLPLFDESPVCVGPLRENLDGASYTVRAAVHSRQAARCLANAPRPTRSDDVLPERALLGDDDARQELYDNVYKVLRGNDDNNPLLLTLSTFLLSGNSLDVTARELNVHPNTVRYRLKRSVEVTGWDPMDPREAYVLLTAIKIGMMLDTEA